MEDMAEQFARRDRYRRRLQQAMTSAERMEQMYRMQQSAWAVLSKSVNGYDHFMRTNFRKRAIDWREDDSR